MIWDRVSKWVYVGAETLELQICDSVAYFNIGCQAALSVLRNMDTLGSSLQLSIVESKDKDTTKKKRKF